jgi:PAS domain S-box-containing protein
LVSLYGDMPANSTEQIKNLRWYSMGLPRVYQILIWISFVITLLICFLDLAGWLFNITPFKSVLAEWESMKLITSICFIFVSVALITIQLLSKPVFHKIVQRVLASFVFLISLVTIYVYLHFIITGYESSLTGKSYLAFFVTPVSRMALLTAINFLLISCIIFLLSINKKITSAIAHALALPVMLVSYFAAVSYVLGVYSATELEGVSVSFNTDIAFCCICGVILLMRPETWLLRVFTSDNLGGLISRRLIPAIMIIPVIIGWLRIKGEHAGLFESEKGVVLVAVIYTVCFLILVWFLARSVGTINQKRLATELALKESESRYRKLTENIPDMIARFDSNLSFLYGNQAFMSRMGVQNENPAFKSSTGYDPIADAADKWEKAASEVLNTGESRRLEHTRAWQGKTKVYDVLIVPEPGENNRVNSIISISRDITDYKRAEDDLKELEDKLWSVLNATQESIYMFDPEGKITMSNTTGLERLIATSGNEIVGHNFSEFMAPELAEMRQAKLDKVISSGKPLEFEDERDGKIYHHNFSPVFKSGKVSFVVTYSADVTNRKRAEDKLKESEDRFRTIAESLPILISINRISDSIILFVNEPYEKAFGFINKELTGKKVYDIFFNPEDRKSLSAILKRKGGTYNTEVKVKKSDGTPFWIMTSIRTIMFMNEPAYLTASIDITETKKVQEELLRLNRALNAHSKSSQLMMHSDNELAYLNDVCRIVIEDCGYKMVWIGYALNDRNKSVKPVAYSGYNEGYLDQLNVTWSDTLRGRGPTGTAIRTGKPSICLNMHTDPAFEPWRKEAIKRGYASSLVLPLISDNKAFGAITIYSGETNIFLEKEIILLSDLASDLAYGISYFRLSESEKKAVNAIKESEAQLKELNATKDKFFNIIAHDLKNPFTSLLGSSELLYNNINQMSKENIIDLTLILNDSAKSGYAILLNLLDWSRSQTGLLKVNPESYPLLTKRLFCILWLKEI